ncbi:MAG TPA: FMN-binding protein [Chloroflexota bacterium]|nr:FMN-binding protein [Chloroflexota bacterium]
MAKKIPRRLVALSSSAVAAIYFAGLLTSRAAIDTQSAVAASVAPTTVSSAASSASVSSGYQDGTFTGTGSGKFGSITVSVSTSGGKITSVQITKVATTFPASQIASLPAQVVQRQTASVNAVSGATASTQAFKQAVQQALVQAATVTTSA